MSPTKAVKRFLILSLIVLAGLTIFHRFVDGKSKGRSLEMAAKQYASALWWVTRRLRGGGGQEIAE